MGYIEQWFQWLGELCWNLITWLFEAWGQVVTWIYQFSLQRFAALIDFAAPQTGVASGDVIPYVEAVNYWAPVDHFFAAVVYMCVFYTVKGAVQWTIKLATGVF